MPRIWAISVIHFVDAACTFAKNSNDLGDEASSLYLIVPFQGMTVGTANVRETVDSNSVMTQPSLDEFSNRGSCLKNTIEAAIR